MNGEKNSSDLLANRPTDRPTRQGYTEIKILTSGLEVMQPDQEERLSTHSLYYLRTKRIFARCCSSMDMDGL